ncbi:MULTISPECIES: DUF3137 domain-containing protein [unclassified Vibrio]|uniref:DUF3137 domain-containing protein n=1 Tax=unclassified Vibrio TaxID=2614977 RepID=UPI001EFCA8E8|nr:MULTISPECIES: DUF3137 domain-containing protein [unclassified Vibrio]MCG9555350.1 DUF3137 domain-containing protein [Vibrio sp. Isolate32]
MSEKDASQIKLETILLYPFVRTEEAKAKLKDDLYHSKVSFMEESMEKLDNAQSTDEVYAEVDCINDNHTNLFWSSDMSASVNILKKVMLVSWGLLVVILASYFYAKIEVFRRYQDTETLNTVVMIASIVLFAIGKLYQSKRREIFEGLIKNINQLQAKLSRKVYVRTIELRHGMQKTSANQGFLDFKRCNYRNYVDDCFSLEKYKDTNLSDCKIIRTAHTKETVRKKGHGKKQTIERTYSTGYRWGIIVPCFTDASPMIISQSRSSNADQSARNEYIEYKTSSINFEKCFYTEGVDKIAIARVLTPKLMLFIEELADDLGNLTFEINKKNMLLIHQSRHKMIDEMGSNLRDTNKFKKELIEKTEFSSFFTLLDQITPLYK